MKVSGYGISVWLYIVFSLWNIGHEPPHDHFCASWWVCFWDWIAEFCNYANDRVNYSETATTVDNTTTPWLAGLRLDSFPGPSFSEQVAQAANHLGVDILSPAAVHSAGSEDPALPGYVPFSTKEMIDEAHRLGLQVKPWTVSWFILPQALGWANYPGLSY